jgi:pimeloyl-ACP methyl ester carboxylesterase/predicted nucleotidyltransferase
MEGTAEKLLQRISASIKGAFDRNLICVLLYGSSLREMEFSDLDILVILRNKKDVYAESTILKTIKQGFPEVNLDLQLMYEIECASPAMFSLDAHGAFFYDVLKSSRVLFGSNPFIKHELQTNERIISLIDNIQSYIFRARQEFMGHGRHSKDTNPLYHQKHVRRVLLDVLLMFGNYEADEVLEKFKELFPSALDAKDLRLLQSLEEDVSNYLGLYEKIYDIGLATAATLVPLTIVRPTRITIEGIVTECILQKENSRGSILFADGLPRVPEADKFLNLLASWGYDVFYPRLRGTWESEGSFLKEHPGEDILAIIEALTKGISIKETQFRSDKQILVGISFGTLSVVHASSHPSIQTVIAISPIISMRDIVSIESLEAYIREFFPGSYRFLSEDWAQLMQGKIDLNPDIFNSGDRGLGKYHFIAAEQDEQIPFDSLVKFCTKNNIKLHAIPGAHLSLERSQQQLFPILRKLLHRDI